MIALIAQPEALLPGTNEVLMKSYTGIKLIDYQLTILVVFFSPVVDFDGTRPSGALSLFSRFGIGQFGGVWCLMVMETLRMGNRDRFILSFALYVPSLQFSALRLTYQQYRRDRTHLPVHLVHDHDPTMALRPRPHLTRREAIFRNPRKKRPTHSNLRSPSLTILNHLRLHHSHSPHGPINTRRGIARNPPKTHSVLATLPNLDRHRTRQPAHCLPMVLLLPAHLKI